MPEQSATDTDKSGPTNPPRLDTTMNDSPLHTKIREQSPNLDQYPNLEAVHGHGDDSFQIDLPDDCWLVVTNEDDDLYMIGVYDAAAWTEGTGEVLYAEGTATHAVRTLDALTDGNPEGTDYFTWATQWVLDQIDANASIDNL